MEEKKSLEKQLNESAPEQLSDAELETVSGGTIKTMNTQSTDTSKNVTIGENTLADSNMINNIKVR